MQNSKDDPRVERAPAKPPAASVAKHAVASPSSKAVQGAPITLTSLRPLHEVNEHCIDMLVQAARKDSTGAPALVRHLRELLRAMSPESRARTAQRPLLLVDMQLADFEWWRTAKSHATRAAPLPAWRGSFPRPQGVQLARATLMLAWHTVRADRYGTCLLGMSPGVSEIIASLSLTEIDRIVERCFRHARPRWEERPAVWRRLLLAGQSESARLTRDVNLYGLQLLTGELLA
jgi:hypothetical protein